MIGVELKNKRMKKIIILLAFSIFSANIFAQSKCESKVAAVVEQLRLAMISGDSTELKKLVSEKLNYGHSGGHIDDKKEFVEKLTSGKSDFVTIELKDQSIVISKKVAIVRHELHAVTNDNNKPGDVHLRVLLILQKKKGNWKLLARQAVKIEPKK